MKKKKRGSARQCPQAAASAKRPRRVLTPVSLSASQLNVSPLQKSQCSEFRLSSPPNSRASGGSAGPIWDGCDGVAALFGLVHTSARLAETAARCAG